eukprot:TRINITY_DN17079_c0_g1_i2.p1 TRINITY_DN17079_c0_g1~~TRINITY_DN17079_c0_g1_i2.p1  ORF type:complete len:572 (-),score=66.48 TRINITY_DN17079_c0_g1_i2:454-2169(-)
MMTGVEGFRMPPFMRVAAVAIFLLFLVTVLYQTLFVERVVLVSNSPDAVLGRTPGPGGTVGSKQLINNMGFELSFLRSNALERLDNIVKDINELKSSEHELLETVLKKQQVTLEEKLDKSERTTREMARHVESLENAFQTHLLRERQSRPVVKDKLLHGDPESWQQYGWSKHSPFGFIQYSTYRIGDDDFVTVGIGAKRLHEGRKVEGCRWFGKNGKEVPGTISFTFNTESHEMQYEALLLRCQLEEVTGSTGGYLIGTVDGEEIVLLNEKSMPEWEGKSPYKYKFLHCSPPIFGQLDPRSMHEWMDFHRATVGFDHFVFYDMQALGDDLRERLKEYIDGGWITIVDFKEALSFEVWWWAQHVAMWDCMFRSRTVAKWIAFLDFDEYLQAIPPYTMGSYLKEHNDKSWISHGVVWWGVESCMETSRGRDKAKFIEEMAFRWPGHYCMGKEKYPNWRFCLDHYGHRKFIANPRKVWNVEIHKVLEPSDTGHDANSETEIVHNHYQGLASKVPGPKVVGIPEPKLLRRCSRPRENTEDDWWVWDTSMRELSERRTSDCPISDRACMEKIFDEE